LRPKSLLNSLGDFVRGKRVLVTGSTRGIGFYAARELASLGARVAIVSRSPENVDMAINEIREYSGYEPLGIVADITTREGIEKAVFDAEKGLEGLDGIVFNIGNIGCEPCYLHEAKYEDWVEAALRHTVAPGYLASVFARLVLEKKRKGTIIFLSSVSVKQPMPIFVLADTARAGLVQLSKSIALQYADKGLRAFTILLGSFDTPGARKNIQKMAKRLGISFEEAWKRFVIDATPLKRVAKPEELGALLAFLFSPFSDYMNGSTLVFDGVLNKCV
jgi:NAD(P)-dependent dehydrogenase (short-subunit alcohol dehydrogenase family)